MRVAFLGSRGIPARYGGYETLIEELATRLAANGIEAIVYCRTAYYRVRPADLDGVRLVYVPAPRIKGIESLLHSFLSAVHVASQAVDLVYFVDPANAPFCLILRLLGKRVVLHTDGLGWKRRKWGRLGGRLYKAAEWLAARTATGLVTDHPAIQDYYRAEYGAESALITYGATNGAGRDDTVYGDYDLTPGGYCLVVARLEPENNTELIVSEYGRIALFRPLVVVGSSPYDPSFLERLKGAGPHVRFLGRIDDQAKLNSLYAGAYLYIHGHEVGGTNPSLLRAMDAATAPVVLDVPFNVQVVGDAGFVFGKDRGRLAQLLKDLDDRPEAVAAAAERARDRARTAYRWERVAEQHEDLFVRIAQGRRSSA